MQKYIKFTGKYSDLKKKPKFDVAKPLIKFTCDWAVYPVGSDSSMCYTTSEERAKLIADALNKYKGWEKWVKK